MRCETGQVLNCYEAGRLLVDRGASRLGSERLDPSPPLFKSHHKPTSPIPNHPTKGKEDRGNHAISQNLIPLLTKQ